MFMHQPSPNFDFFAFPREADARWRLCRQCRRHRPKGSLKEADPADVKLCYTIAAGARPEKHGNDRLVGTVEYPSTGKIGEPNVTEYVYDKHGNLVVERVNPSDLLAKLHGATDLVPPGAGANLDTAALRVSIQNNLDKYRNQGGSVLEKYQFYTSNSETSSLFYEDSVVVLKDARGEDSLETRIARVNALFDPFGRYVAGARTGEFALNLHPDSGAARSWFGGRYTVRDSVYLRPLREYVYAAGTVLPARDWSYGSANPYFATGERVYVDSVGGGMWRARLTEREADASYGNYPAKVRLCSQEQRVDTATFAWSPALGPCPETSFLYNWRGQPVKEIDPLSRQTERGYDTLGREAWVKWPDGAQRSWTWHDLLGADGKGKFVEEKNESGIAVRRWFTGLGDPWKEGVYSADDKDSSVALSEYNIFGKLRWHRDADGRETRRGYDSQARLVSEVRRGEGLKDYVRTYNWVDSSRILVETDGNGTQTSYRYNLYGQDEEVTRQVNDTVAYVERHVFDNQGREVLGIAPDGDTTLSVYGWTGKADTIIYPDRMSVLSRYTQLGEPVLAVRSGQGAGLAYGAKTDTLYWTLDGQGRETESGVRGDARSVRHSSWDNAGRLTQIALGTGLTESFLYDGRSRMTRRALSGMVDGVNVADTVTNGYRADGLRTSLQVRDASYTWNYDGLGRVESLSLKDPAGKVHEVLTDVRYTAGGLPLGYGLAHDVAVAQEYVVGQPWLKNWSATFDTTELQRMDYAHDREGNIVEMSRPGAGRASYLYDGLYRLTAARYPTGGSANTAGTLNYGYTLNGNRTKFGHQFGEEGWSYYPGTNLAKSASGDVIGSRVYGFDFLGNRTREREYGTAAQAAAQGGDWTRGRVAGYNSDGGLVRYTVYDNKAMGGVDTSLFAYGRDALGKKNFGATGRINAAGDTAWSASRRYTWDGDWVIADSTEVGRRYYAYLGHRRVAEVAEDTAGKWTARAVLTDHLGTVTGVVGDSGAMDASYLLDPYGNLEHYAGMYQTLLLYTGKEWVSELAGYEVGARVYDPVMGMWWGRDKAAQFWSPWASASNPLRLLDVDGNLQVVSNTSDGIQFEQMETETWGEGLLYLDKNGVGMYLDSKDASENFSLFSGGKLSIVYPSNGNVVSYPAWSGTADGYDPIVPGKYYLLQESNQSWDKLSASDKALALIGRGPWPGGVRSWGHMRSELMPTIQTEQNIVDAGRTGHFFVHGGWIPGSRGCIDLLDNDVSYLLSINDWHPVYVPGR